MTEFQGYLIIFYLSSICALLTHDIYSVCAAAFSALIWLILAIISGVNND